MAHSSEQSAAAQIKPKPLFLAASLELPQEFEFPFPDLFRS